MTTRNYHNLVVIRSDDPDGQLMCKVLNASSITLNVSDNVVIGSYGTATKDFVPAQHFNGVTSNTTHQASRLMRVLGPVYGTPITPGSTGTVVLGGRCGAVKVDSTGRTIVPGDFLSLVTNIPGAAVANNTLVGTGRCFAVADQDRPAADGIGAIRAFVLPWSV